MSRAPFQILVVPFTKHSDGLFRYAVLKRNSSTGGYWQLAAGGGKPGEEPKDAARREAHEEIGSDPESSLIRLDTLTMIPVVNIGGFEWGKDVLVIPEYCFGLELVSETLSLSHEHTDYRWLTYEEASDLVNWESNKTALWELNHRLTHNLPLVRV